MIVHKISKYEYKYQPYQPPPLPVWDRVPPISVPKEPYEFRAPLGQGYTITKIDKWTNKTVYAQWLKSLNLNRGDYLVHRRAIDCGIKLGHLNYLRVVQLQEVHMLLDYTDSGKAKAVEIVNASGTRFWTLPSEWVVVDAPENPEWQFDIPAC